MTPRAAWLAALDALRGTPYVFGGRDPQRDGGLDALGLLLYAAQQAGLDLGAPRDIDALRACGPCVHYGPSTAPDDRAAQPGDLVLFTGTAGGAPRPHATHCGVWLRPGVMLHCHGHVRETAFSDHGYWAGHYLGIWRPRALLAAPVAAPAPAAAAAGPSPEPAGPPAPASAATRSERPSAGPASDSRPAPSRPAARRPAPRPPARRRS